jgi:hypothetical protein
MDIYDGDLIFLQDKMFDEIDEAEKIEILIKMTKGLITFHEKTLKPVHSDIKPSNYLY